MTQLTAPLLRYHGGKWRMADWIISHMPEHRIYVEPFGGGASVLLRKKPSQCEIYNDLDDDIVNLFAVLRDPARAEQLAKQIDLTPFARTEFFGAYASCAEPVEQARRTLVRSQMGFGSAGATKGKTGFRGTGGRQKNHETVLWSQQPDRLLAAAQRLKQAIIENRDALDCIQYYDTPDTLTFVDPPYMHSTRDAATVSGKAYRHEMSDAQHIELLHVLLKCKGKVMLTGYAHPIYDDLLTGWHRVTRQARASGARGGVLRNEVLWMNFEPSTQQFDLFGSATA
jgi:DNA adenine methylase